MVPVLSPANSVISDSASPLPSVTKLSLLPSPPLLTPLVEAACDITLSRPVFHILHWTEAISSHVASGVARKKASSLSPNLPLVVFLGNTVTGTSALGISALGIAGVVASSRGYAGSSAAPHFHPIRANLVVGRRVQGFIHYTTNFKCKSGKVALCDTMDRTALPPVPHFGGVC